MKGLGKKKLWSHLSRYDNDKYTNRKIRLSKAKEVGSFRDLVRIIASISYNSPEYSLFYRGQGEDYELLSGASSLYPSIYRMKGRSITKDVLEDKFKILKKAETLLLNVFKSNKLEGHLKLANFRELVWAILQHYEVCKTPLLDITHSLRVASSFALEGSRSYGYVFVLGFPHIHGSISYYVEEELFNIKLLSICPPQAQRPYFQEGFLVGTFPVAEENKQPKLDVAKRLIAKFKIQKPRFWDKDFHEIPHDALYPGNDRVEDICKEIKQQLKLDSIKGTTPDDSLRAG